MRAILLAMCAAAAGAATSPAARSGHGEVEGPAPVRISRQGMVQAEDAALRERAAKALRKAVEFYRTSVAAEGGYHFADAEDLSYDRSEMSEGPTCVEVQRDSTPLVGMAYLEAFEATADSYYLEAAREVARALVKGSTAVAGGITSSSSSRKACAVPVRR